MRLVLSRQVLAGLIVRAIAEGDVMVARMVKDGTPDAEALHLAHQLAGICATFGAAALRHTLIALQLALCDRA